MRASIVLALLILLGAVPAAQAEGGGGGGRAGAFSFSGIHRFGGAQRFAPSRRFAFQRRNFGFGGWEWGAPFVGPYDWGDWGDWAGAPAGYGALPGYGLAALPPPPPPFRTHDERDERASVETTAQGVTIIRGPGSRHIGR